MRRIGSGRVVRLGALEDPAFVLGYPPAAGSPWLVWRLGSFFTAKPELDMSSCRTNLMAGVRVSEVPVASGHTAG